MVVGVTNISTLVTLKGAAAFVVIIGEEYVISTRVSGVEAAWEEAPGAALFP